ncbi:MAG: D-aminoacylase [Rhodospirillaceae bacterium]|nr:D-aminoacylase [Rhodospirillaceae bacterium]
MNDLIFRQVRILDGSGGEELIGDVSVREGRINEVGTVTEGLASSGREIIADGAVLCPGLIDTHAHDDGAFFRHPGMQFKLSQGVTTVVSGNCGFSAIPADPTKDSVAASGGILAGLEGEFTDLDGYYAAALSRQPAINNMMLVGHNTVRSLVMGDSKSAPSDLQLQEMQRHVTHAIEQGACGFSSGLIYRPGRYSDTAEVTELAKMAAPFDALYTTHMRNEGDRLLEAVDESLQIARDSGVHLHISHHKAAGKGNWGKVRESLQRVDMALSQGQPVTLDVYPYTAGSGRMIEYFNLDRVSEELAEVVRIASCKAFRAYEGRMLVDIAVEENISLTDLVIKILTAPLGDRTLCIHFIIDEADVETNLAHADMMVGSDGIPDLRGKPHPRLFGTFPRVLGYYVRERGVLSLSEAVRRMTSLSAKTFGLGERGEIKPGYWADLLLFRPDDVIDEATYDEPKTEASGIDLVVVNGQIALDSGQHSGVGSGQMLRYRRSPFGH